MNPVILGLVLFRCAIIVAAIGLIYRYAAIERRGRSAAAPRRLDVVLGYLALLSVAAHFDLTFRPWPAILVNMHDVFHYYMGSKYSPEVGYGNLYPCTVVADAENHAGRLRFSRVRRMEDYTVVAAREILDAGQDYRARFSPERWREFKADVAFFASSLGERERWTRVVLDHGYNATPLWNALARQLTERLPAARAEAIPLFVSLDLLLMALAFALVAKAFGRRTALLALVFCGTAFALAPGHIRVAFLRLDWLALLVMATCLLRLGRYRTAGALAACAGMLRVFPALFVLGLAARALGELVAGRRTPRGYLHFFAAFLVAAGVLFLLSLADGGGFDGWRGFAWKIRAHQAHIPQNNAGLHSLFPSSWAVPGDGWPWWWAIQAVMLLGFFLAVRRLEDHEAFSSGWVVVYSLLTPTFYYYAMLLVALLLYLPRLELRARAHGAALMFGSSLVGYAAYTITHLARDGVAPSRSVAWPEIGTAESLALSAVLLLVALYSLVSARHQPSIARGA